MKKLTLLLAIIFILSGALFSLLPANRFGTLGDENKRIAGCQTRLSKQNAPVKRNLSILGYYLTSQPIKETTQNWGTCPYSNYRAKTFAAELWIIGAACGMVAYRQNKTRPLPKFI